MDKQNLLTFHSYIFYIGTIPLGLQVLFLIAIWDESQILNSLVLLILELDASLKSQTYKILWMTLYEVILNMKV